MNDSRLREDNGDKFDLIVRKILQRQTLDEFQRLAVTLLIATIVVISGCFVMKGMMFRGFLESNMLTLCSGLRYKIGIKRYSAEWRTKAANSDRACVIEESSSIVTGRSHLGLGHSKRTGKSAL